MQVYKKSIKSLGPSDKKREMDFFWTYIQIIIEVQYNIFQAAEAVYTKSPFNNDSFTAKGWPCMK